jgi:hypothetical protein
MFAARSNRRTDLEKKYFAKQTLISDFKIEISTILLYGLDKFLLL